MHLGLSAGRMSQIRRGEVVVLSLIPQNRNFISSPPHRTPIAWVSYRDQGFSLTSPARTNGCQPPLATGVLPAWSWWSLLLPPRWAMTFTPCTPASARRSGRYCCIAKSVVKLSHGKLRNNRAGRPGRLRRRDRRSRWGPADLDRLQNPGRRRGLDSQRCSVEQDDRS